jgi:putative hemolysin
VSHGVSRRFPAGWLEYRWTHRSESLIWPASLTSIGDGDGEAVLLH